MPNAACPKGGGDKGIVLNILCNQNEESLLVVPTLYYFPEILSLG
jgi:hypothetical protein